MVTFINGAVSFPANLHHQENQKRSLRSLAKRQSSVKVEEGPRFSKRNRLTGLLGQPRLSENSRLRNRSYNRSQYASKKKLYSTGQ